MLQPRNEKTEFLLFFFYRIWEVFKKKKHKREIRGLFGEPDPIWVIRGSWLR